MAYARASVVAVLCGVLLFGGVSSEVIEDENLVVHLQHFFSSWVKQDHGGAGSIKHTNLFERDIQLHIFRVTDMQITGQVKATVTITDTATGESVTKSAIQSNRDDATMQAAVQAAQVLFRGLEEAGIVNAETFLRNGQIQLCNDVKRKTTCALYRERSMCESDNWRGYLKQNCFYTCFNCGKGWN